MYQSPSFRLSRISSVTMKSLLAGFFLLAASGSLLAHPITESAEMSYPGPGEWKETSPSQLLFPGIYYCSTLIRRLRWRNLMSRPESLITEESPFGHSTMVFLCVFNIQCN